MKFFSFNKRSDPMGASSVDKEQGPGARRTLRTHLLAAAVAASTLMPMPAHAWCGVCAQVSIEIAQAQQAILNAINISTNNITTAISNSTQQIKMAIQSSTESVVSAEEKSSQAQKEIEQGSLNYKAAAATTEAFAQVQQQFILPESQPFKRCEILEQASQANDAADNARIVTKTRMSTHAKRNAFTENSAAESRKILKDYKDKYCSEDDKRRGRCETVAPKLMQAAPLRADSLLLPTTNNTYTKEEAEAADAFIKMVSNPVPLETLPRGMEKSAGADRYIIEQMHAAAQMSVAQISLESIRNSKMSSEDNAGVATAQGYSGSMSLMGMMEKFVKDKFGNPDYATALAKTNEFGLLKELNIQMSYSNWMNYHQYVQNERVEILMATQLAMAARERADRQIALARSLVAKSR